MFDEFLKIVNSSGKIHYFDNEYFYKNILKCDYDIFTSGNFTILVEQRNLYSLKIGHSRGGIRFTGSPKLNEFENFVAELETFLSKNKYVFIGLEYLEETNELIESLEPSRYRYVMEGSAFIYPNENWISKFNSEKRNKLLYASKHGVTFEIINGTNIDNEKLEKIYSLLQDTAKSHDNFKIPTEIEFNSLVKNLECLIAYGIYKNEIICFDLLMTMADKCERLYSATNTKGRELRAIANLEMEVVKYLHEHNYKIYDLWGVKKDKGFTDFKLSIADELVDYDGKYRLIKVNDFLANPILTAWNLLN